MTVRELLDLPGFGRRGFASLLACVKACWTVQARLHPGRNESPTMTVFRDELELAAALGQVLPDLQPKHLPTPPSGLNWSEFNFRYGTAKFLTQLGRATDAELRIELSQVTIKELASRGATPALLYDLLCGIETAGYHRWGDPERFTDSEALDAARRLSQHPSAVHVYADDPRFGALLQFLAHEAQDARQAAEIIIAVAENATVRSRLRHVVTLERAIRHAESLDFPEELAAFAEVIANERNRSILEYRLGWGGQPPHSLSAVGERFGITGERVRQVCQAAQDRLNTRRPFAPALDKVISQINSSASGVSAHVAADFATVESAARVLGRVLSR